MSAYLYKGYKISNLGYHQPDHCVWWEAVDKNGFACFHGNTLREVEMLIDDSEWEDKIKVKDAEIERLRALVGKLADIVDGPLCHQDCANCPHYIKCSTKRLRALVAKAREEVKDA